VARLRLQLKVPSKREANKENLLKRSSSIPKNSIPSISNQLSAKKNKKKLSLIKPEKFSRSESERIVIA
jgi:hypothetical protein